jgi:pyruvate formate lyase activating enzyme
MEKTQLSGYVAGIKRYMTHDGPGIRTVVFLKGCPLRCVWCSSPQTWQQAPNIIYRAKKCIRCGSCVKACGKAFSGACVEDAGGSDAASTGDPARAAAVAVARAISVSPDGLIAVDRYLCTRCGACVDLCPTEALAFDSSAMRVSEVMEVVERDIEYYRKSGGGVTLSGGEPTEQKEFSLEILKRCREEGIHAAMETTGIAEWDDLADILPFVDLVLYDVKHMDSARHRELTGQGNERILDNLSRIARETSVPVEVHVPLVPEYNDSLENIRSLLDFLSPSRIRNIDILPFHKLGSHEYEELGIEYRLKDHRVLSPAELDAVREYVRSRGFELPR